MVGKCLQNYSAKSESIWTALLNATRRLTECFLAQNCHFCFPISYGRPNDTPCPGKSRKFLLRKDPVPIGIQTQPPSAWLFYERSMVPPVDSKAFTQISFWITTNICWIRKSIGRKLLNLFWCKPYSLTSESLPWSSEVLINLNNFDMCWTHSCLIRRETYTPNTSWGKENQFSLSRNVLRKWNLSK